ncbi:MAG: agmatine deiminase family protein, partial [Candidatus Cloacimonetes bacterium]|nr:agmatine deiminase family protein [Candidatus Cloacimonadota bacterium]
EPYTNSLIVNNTVYVPIMNSSNDSAALAVYQNAMPGYEVLGFNHSWESTDALHCRINGIADTGMLSISHQPVSSEQSPFQDYLIHAKITAFSNNSLYSDSILVYYKTEGESLYQSVVMNQDDDDYYSAAIPGYPGDTTINYYIHAADYSGRSENHPYIGKYDPHTFTVSAGLDSPVISINMDNGVRIEWNEIDGAVSYLVYASENPYAEDWGRPIAITSELFYLESVEQRQKYFMVKASTQTTEILRKQTEVTNE